MYLAKDIMAKNVISVKKDTSVAEVLTIMDQKNITGMPVVSDDNELIGIVSEKDLLKLLLESKSFDAHVSEYMSTQITTFEENATLIDICKSLMENTFRRVPILSRGKVVGIISRRDIIKFLVRQKQDQLNKGK